MKKKIRKIILVVVVVLVVLVVAVVLGIDRIAKTGTEVGATYALGVPTTLDSADIGILQGRTELQQLQVNNPEGFDSPHFLKLNRGALTVSLGSLTSDLVEVPEFTLEGIEVNLEKKGAQSNYQVILDNLKKFESQGESEPAKKETKEGKRFVIRETLIKDVKVRVKAAPLGATLIDVTVPIDEIRLRDVGSDSNKGVLVSELTGTILKAIILATAEKGGNLIPKDVLGDLDGALKSLASLKDVGASLSVGVGEAAKEIGAGVQQATQQLQEGTRKAAEEAQKASEQLQEGAKKAADDVAGKIGDLLKKPEDKKPE
ncbi:MAG TPA: hypothetical protein PLL20_15455 [Phycisphaerae bacterium]|nr:hypothetical protein [Phycisphaerae bacterium]HRR84184.1 hypothetical protein [Phycisphaerae bacterium]